MDAGCLILSVTLAQEVRSYLEQFSKVRLEITLKGFGAHNEIMHGVCKMQMMSASLNCKD